MANGERVVAAVPGAEDKRFMYRRPVSGDGACAAMIS